MNFLKSSILLLALGAAPALQAQEAHVGFGINLGFPTGDFRSKTYPPSANVTSSQTDGYDLGLGGQLTVSFPVDPSFAFRLNFNGMSTEGTNTASGYNDLKLKHEIFSIGGDMQLFLNGGAIRHKGAYLLAGISADFERFDRSNSSTFSDWWGDANTDTTRKSRLGGNFGFGNSFGYGGGTHFTLEVGFHKTLSGNDQARKEPPSSDFMKVSFGWVF